MSTVSAQLPLPESVDVAELRLELALDDEASARREAETIFSEVTASFAAQHVLLSLVYELEIEIVGSERGSWKFVAKARLKLRDGWKQLKRTVPPVYLAVTTALGGAAAYPDLREGSIQLANDIKTGYEYVIGKKESTNPGLVKDHSCSPVEPTIQAPKHD